MKKIKYICDRCGGDATINFYTINIHQNADIDGKFTTTGFMNNMHNNMSKMLDKQKIYCQKCIYDIQNHMDHIDNNYLNDNVSLTLSLNKKQLNYINNKMIEIESVYAKRINNTIDYVKDCLEHLCTVDEIEILNKLGYNSDIEE